MKTLFVLQSILGVLALELEAAPHPQEKIRSLPAALVQAARLDRYGHDCVAQDPISSTCLLTVDAFNRALEYAEVPFREEGRDFPAQTDLDAIRGEVLRQILEQKYFTAFPIPARDKDSLSALADASVFERREASRAALGDPALRAAYRELFPAVFQGKEEALFEVLASTDSLRLDSLRSAFDSGDRRPWPIVTEAELPAEALHAVRAAGTGAKIVPKTGALAGPVRVPFGYLFLREASRRRQPDVPMAEALPLLISWKSIPAGGEPGWEGDMEAFYRQHPELFITPDTLTFRAWLLPGTGPVAASRRLNRDRMRLDTANTHSITMRGEDLPGRLREELSNSRACRQGETLGPIPSVFGTWYLLAQEVRKGGRRLTLEESRPVLAKRAYGWDGPEFLVPAVADAHARENDIRTAITAQYLMAQKPDNGASGTISWESKRNDWMRNHLVLRFVELPDPGALPPSTASAPVPDSAWSDGVENARDP